MSPQRTLEIESELVERAERIAQADGISVSDLTAEALRRELARRFLEKTRREALVRRGNMSDEEVELAVDAAVQSWRREHRGR
jgi:hypothetical protein